MIQRSTSLKYETSLVPHCDSVAPANRSVTRKIDRATARMLRALSLSLSPSLALFCFLSLSLYISLPLSPSLFLSLHFSLSQRTLTAPMNDRRWIECTGLGRRTRFTATASSPRYRERLFFFHLMATKITTQFVLISNIKEFV